MKILIFSDSHGSLSYMEDAIERIKHDKIIFLGDTTSDIDDIKKFYPNEKIAVVRGNNDFLSSYPDRLILEESGHRIYCCHGHSENVKQSLLTLSYKAAEEKCDVALFGHTHRPFSEFHNGILILNPGAVSYMGSFLLLTLEKGKTPEYKFFEI